MEYKTFKDAYFNEHPVARIIGRQLDLAFEALVKDGVIPEYSSLWFGMCQVAWESREKALYDLRFRDFRR
jgi:hypothetical protein